MAKPRPDGVVFGRLADWQKPDCINCDADATQQANYRSALVRCCAAPACMARAAEIAKLAGRA